MLVMCRHTWEPGTFIGVSNAGAIRHAIAQGPIDEGLIKKILPFDDDIVEGWLQGAYLQEMLEHGVSILAPHGRFLAVDVRSPTERPDDRVRHGNHFLCCRASRLFGTPSFPLERG